MHLSARNSARGRHSNVCNAGPGVHSTKLLAAAKRGALTLAVLSTLLLSRAHPAQAQTETILHRFTGGSGGAEAMGQLTPDGAGNFYGTTNIGGLGYGTVFKLSPDGSGGWTETVLHSFTDYLDGGYPFFTTLIFDSQGNLYGTTTGGGPNGHGVVFELSPVGTEWEETVLYSTGQDGSAGCADPWGGVIEDANGNFYGMCLLSGFPQTEAIFELSQANGVWTQNVIYNYDSPADNNGAGGLTMDATGNIFAMLSAAYDAPSLVELSPNGSGGWTPTVIRIFGPDIFPESVPVLDGAGNVYGTTGSGGKFNRGTVYQSSPGDNGEWTEKILYSFGSSNDGFGPFGGIIFDASGNIYGTTSAGGASNSGSVFKLTRDVQGIYQQKVLWIFDVTDGAQPLSSLTLDNAGNLYGTTPTGGGGKCNAPEICGVAFEVSP
jgi:uncharacterized repeat protein (TIGR03803 family)